VTVKLSGRPVDPAKTPADCRFRIRKRPQQMSSNFGQNGYPAGDSGNCATFLANDPDALLRMSVFAESVSRNVRPVIFSQCSYPVSMSRHTPGTCLDILRTLPADGGLTIGRCVNSYLRLHSRAVLVEDTEPAAIDLDPSFYRALIVPPIGFGALQGLRERIQELYDLFLVTDHPLSPTWQYSNEETESLMSWDRWKMVGPVYQPLNRSRYGAVKARYALRSGDKSCVFAAGSGRQLHEAKAFIERSVFLADQMHSAGYQRLIVVQSRVLSHQVKVPSCFEVIDDELCLPELLHAAGRVVIQPAATAIWNCIGAGVPFYALPETEESSVPVCSGHPGSLSELMPGSVAEWLSERWTDQFEAASRRYRTSWPGRPDAKSLASVFEQSTRRRVAGPAIRSARTEIGREHLEQIARGKRLLIRIDDVIDMDDSLVWALSACQKRRLPASLEVVPYFTNLADSDFDALEKQDQLFEVSQHGFSHVPQVAAGMRGEYLAECKPLPSYISAQLSTGRRILQERFPARFRDGYSPPFDGLPPWLPRVWGKVGGRYLSIISATIRHWAIPIVRVGVDIWDWQNGRPRPLAETLRLLAAEMDTTGYAGIVLHTKPQYLSGHAGYFTELLDMLLEAGMRGAAISSCVTS
jgi:hypothetical protein